MGTVQNGSAAPISNVKVTLKNHATISNTTNASGNFTITANITGLTVLDQDETISFGANGLVKFHAYNEAVRIEIFNVSGQHLYTIINESHLNGSFQVFASAYVPQDFGIYFVRIIVGNKAESCKFISCNSNTSKGLMEMSSTPSAIYLKSSTLVVDSLMFTHNDYKTVKIGLSNYTANLGIITMDAIVTIPAAPVNLTTSAVSSSQINLSWTDNSNNEDGFNIERAPGGTTNFVEIATVGSGVTTYQNTGLTGSSTYIYRVRAHNSAGYSGYTTNATATTLVALVPPAAPSNLKVVALNPTVINITWQDNSNNETGFEIQREIVGLANGWATVTTTAANAQGYSHTNLTETYLGYRVRAVNSAGQSAWTTVAYAPRVLRIVNDLYDKSDGYGNWANLNTIIRVRIGPDQNSVSTTTNYERFNPNDIQSYIGNSLPPKYNASTSYYDFPIDSYSGLGTQYYIYVQCGWWDYAGGWDVHVSSVICTNGTCCCYKYVIDRLTHSAGYIVLTATQGCSLPLGNWNNTY